MPASVTRSAPSSTYRTLAAISIVHAVLILLLWVGMFKFDFDAVPGRAWLILFLLWLIWPLVLLLHPERSAVRVLVPCLVGIALLAPCLSTAWTFTVWAIGGFAP